MQLPEQIRVMFRPQAAWYGLLAAIILTWIGMEAIATVDASRAAAQMRWLPIAIVFMLMCMIPHPRVIGMVSYPLMAVSLLLLVITIVPGMPRSIVPVRNGATCWINLHFMMFQPAEMAKVVFVLALAWYLRYRDTYRTLRGLLVPFGMMLAPVGLLLKQPDLGLALLYPPTLFAMLVAAGAKLRHLGTLIGLGVLAIALNVSLIYVLPPDQPHPFLKSHQVARIKSMISLVKGEDRYIQDLAYQQHKAMTLIGAGQLTGYGEERAATVIRFNRLPETYNDMIFAVIVNRWGMIGGVVTLGLYLVVVLSFVLVAAKSKDPFARLACVGFAGLTFSQATINIGMTLGLLPITGINLPFVSYGGSSLISTFAMMGLVINFGSRRPGYLTRPSFEFDTVKQGEKLLIKQ